MQPPAAPPRLIDQTVSVPCLPSYRKLSDLALVRRAREGDRTALDALVERHSPRVNKLAAQLMGDFEDARDAAQESLVKLCTRLRQFRGDAQFATWLHRLVVNTCRDVAARKLARPADPLDLADEPAGEESDPSRAAMLGDLRRDLVDALGRLSSEQRVAVVLRDAFDLPYEEIARRARMPVGTAKCYVHRGHERLRARLQELAAG
jgi:RNA polymerase sigma-70 factor (ECF subfamily)